MPMLLLIIAAYTVALITEIVSQMNIHFSKDCVGLQNQNFIELAFFYF
jgi:hypothetical protein